MTKSELKQKIINLKMEAVHNKLVVPMLTSLQAEMSRRNKAAKIRSAIKIASKLQERSLMVAEQSAGYNKKGMNLQEIKDAVDAGKRVHWSSPGYLVLKEKGGDDYLIQFQHGSKSSIGLTWQDGVTMNGKPEEFFIGD